MDAPGIDGGGGHRLAHGLHVARLRRLGAAHQVRGEGHVDRPDRPALVLQALVLQARSRDLPRGRLATGRRGGQPRRRAARRPAAGRGPLPPRPAL